MDNGLDVTLLPASVSPLVAAEVAGAPRRRRVVAAFPTCLYVELGAHERVLAVLASDALALPIGLRLALPSTRVSWGLEAGAHVVVGQGRVRLPGADVVAARLQHPSRVRPAPRRPGPPTGLREPGVLGDLAREMAAAALAGRSVDSGVRGLLGAGRGLTPSGDDAVCGVLLTLGAVDVPRARRAHAAIAAEVRAGLGRTTSLSAALLVAAASGYAVPDVVRLVTGLVSGTVSADLVDRVLGIGHSSGRDLLSGVTGTLRALDASLETTPQKGACRG
ncbi:oxamate carbamoyltransferase subunit AllH family protein [Terrabacter terrigena]|uniref:DUF2877 domain-containing protein n=1 Tax=Terrabacter terrigena TaxID=574718 RepID=A0ABW3MYQ5_9MICO